MNYEQKYCDYKYIFTTREKKKEERSCSRMAVQGSSKCILHIARDSVKKDTDSFNKEMLKSINDERPLFKPFHDRQKEGIDFHGIITPPNWNAKNVLKAPRKMPLYFEYADLSGACFNRVNLSLCSFYRANLQNCDLFGANLSNCDLKRADIRGASLNRSIIKGAITWHLKYNRKTQFSWIDTTETDWSYNQMLRQTISIYQKKEQLKVEFPTLACMWYLFGDYGRSISLVLLRMLIISVSFGFIYLLILPSFYSVGCFNRYVFPFIYSLSSFFGLGYKLGFEPTKVMQILSIIEGIAGYLMLGVLIAIFLSKVKD